MTAEKIFIYAGLACFALVSVMLLHYLNLLVVNALRKWMPDGPRRQMWLAGSEDVPTISEHFGAAKRLALRIVLIVVMSATTVGVLAGIVSIAVVLPLCRNPGQVEYSFNLTPTFVLTSVGSG